MPPLAQMLSHTLFQVSPIVICYCNLLRDLQQCMAVWFSCCLWMLAKTEKIDKPRNIRLVWFG